VTLALVLDGSGFPRQRGLRRQCQRAQDLGADAQAAVGRPGADGPTVVLDAGIASEENIAWLHGQGYRYLAVSRERHKQFDADQATLIRAEGDTRIRAQRLVDEDSREVRLYCHSTGREAKERDCTTLLDAIGGGAPAPGRGAAPAPAGEELREGARAHRAAAPALLAGGSLLRHPLEKDEAGVTPRPSSGRALPRRGYPPGV